ncbi:MAG TPA: hypothetical protein VGI39_23495 [Polyangiaceae bacterium]|jgi:hypothetical protein
MPPSKFLFLAALLLGASALGCSPSIGDHCVLSTDCSLTGNLQCDTSMPNGYCTIFNCAPNACPGGDACYLFDPEVQGCPYSDRQPSRTAHSFCLKGCSNDSDCRQGDGYVCRDPRLHPFDAILLDDNQSHTGMCVPGPDRAEEAGVVLGPSSDAEAICVGTPPEDAALPPLPDTGAPLSDAGGDGGGDAEAGKGDAGSDAAVDAGRDSSAGAMDAGIDATLPTDAGSDASGDASALDATTD